MEFISHSNCCSHYLRSNVEFNRDSPSRGPLFHLDEIGFSKFSFHEFLLSLWSVNLLSLFLHLCQQLISIRIAQSSSSFCLSFSISSLLLAFGKDVSVQAQFFLFRYPKYEVLYRAIARGRLFSQALFEVSITTIDSSHSWIGRSFFRFLSPLPLSCTDYLLILFSLIRQILMHGGALLSRALAEKVCVAFAKKEDRYGTASWGRRIDLVTFSAIIQKVEELVS